MKSLRKALKHLALILIYTPPFQKIFDFALRSNLTPTLKNLKDLGFNPDLIIDVGAYIGEWSIEALQVFTDASGVMFEPQTDKREGLLSVCNRYSGRLTLQSTLLGSSTGFRDFFRLETGSSLYRENTLHTPVIEKLAVKTLDDCLEHSKGSRILLKLDVQGAEKDVLLGASKILSKVEVLIMELSFLQYNEGSPLIGEMIEYASELGFVPFSVFGINRMNGQCVQTDMVFVRRGSPLLEAASRAFRN
jgi:FkbM family methyltransferase